MLIEHPIEYDDGDVTVGAAPILKVYSATDFPCRDEDKADEVHQAELEDIAREVVRLAELSRKMTHAPWESLRRAMRAVLQERHRQIGVEGYTPKHDDGHARGEIAMAAASYAMSAGGVTWSKGGCPAWFPWGRGAWKDHTPERALEIAGALILAELERRYRAAEEAAR